MSWLNQVEFFSQMFSFQKKKTQKYCSVWMVVLLYWNISLTRTKKKQTIKPQRPVMNRIVFFGGRRRRRIYFFLCWTNKHLWKVRVWKEMYPLCIFELSISFSERKKTKPRRWMIIMKERERKKKVKEKYKSLSCCFGSNQIFHTQKLIWYCTTSIWEIYWKFTFFNNYSPYCTYYIGYNFYLIISYQLLII